MGEYIDHAKKLRIVAGSGVGAENAEDVELAARYIEALESRLIHTKIAHAKEIIKYGESMLALMDRIKNEAEDGADR